METGETHPTSGPKARKAKERQGQRNAAARHAAQSGGLHSYNFGVALASYHKTGTPSIVGDGEPAGSNPGAREDSASVSSSQAGDIEMTGALDLGADEMNAWGKKKRRTSSPTMRERGLTSPLRPVERQFVL